MQRVESLIKNGMRVRNTKEKREWMRRLWGWAG